MDASQDTVQVATLCPPRQGEADPDDGGWFHVVRWYDGTSSIVDRLTRADMERVAAEQVVGLA